MDDLFPCGSDGERRDAVVVHEVSHTGVLIRFAQAHHHPPQQMYICSVCVCCLLLFLSGALFVADCTAVYASLFACMLAG